MIAYKMMGEKFSVYKCVCAWTKWNIMYVQCERAQKNGLTVFNGMGNR